MKQSIGHKVILARVVAILALATATSAFADARSAAHSLFNNLARSHSTLSVNEATALVGPTLVKGVYTLSNQQGRFVGFTNEAGTIFGDSRGFNVLATNGAAPRQMTLDEAADLRAEVVGAIDYAKLPKLVHGDGGNRHLLVFSAIDCPFCKGFEEAMRKQSAGLNTTMYVVPASLQKIAQGGYAQWQAVSRIWCADDAGAAWANYWSTLSVPQAQQCRFADPQVAELAVQQLKDILQGVGLRVMGTPQVLREDGVVIPNKPNMDGTYIASTFGAASAPQVNSKPVRWLLASADDSFQMQAVAAPGAYPAPQQPQARPQQAPSKVGLSDLKKLFK